MGLGDTITASVTGAEKRLLTDELMGAVVASITSLRTERRISHAYVVEVPDDPVSFIITDAAINIAPTLEEKADIIRNAIDLELVNRRSAHMLNVINQSRQ